ncbi:MAG TPA: hypothetical protein VM694_23320 [Polyangium sp.]|nr:hypothetical protein [Polyangium sp.]
MDALGAIDKERADEIMNALLDGVSRYAAHTAILDVHLGEGFGGITTRSTLRAGIAWALRR